LRYFLSAALCQPYILAAQALSQNIISGEMAAVCTKKRNRIRSVGLGPATSIHPTMCNSTSKIGYSVLIHIVGMDTSKLGHVGKRCIGSFSSSTGERVTQQMSSCWKGLFSLPFSKDTYLFPEKYHDVC
jgi:hypothetical protein